MLSEAQKTLHWRYKAPGWAWVCHVNDWHMKNGRLVPEAQNTRNESEWIRKTWAFAEMLARQEHRAVKPDDLRKGAYMVALGKPKSLTAFDNDDLDRVLIIFRLLIEPDDLTAVREQIAYEEYDAAVKERQRCSTLGIPCAVELPDHPGERRRHIAGIKQRAPEAYIIKVSQDKFGTMYWETLKLSQLRELTRTLANRRATWQRPARPAAAPQRELVYSKKNAPF